jgi:hypothetical protein
MSYADMTTWRKQLIAAMEGYGEKLEDIDSSTLTDAQLDAEFDAGYGGIEGYEFTVWTKNRVYFPATYDGAEWVASVSRNPDGQPTSHIGGG